MRKFTRKSLIVFLFLVFMIVFSSCTVTIGPIGTNVNITINNTTLVSVTVEFSGGLPDRVIAAGNGAILNLPLNTILTVHTTILPPLYFAVDDVAGQYNFTLDGAGYTLFAEDGFVNTYSLRVTRVL